MPSRQRCDECGRDLPGSAPGALRGATDRIVLLCADCVPLARLRIVPPPPPEPPKRPFVYRGRS